MNSKKQVNTDRKNVTDFLYLVLHLAHNVTYYYWLFSLVMVSVLRTSINVLSKSKSRNYVTFMLLLAATEKRQMGRNFIKNIYDPLLLGIQLAQPLDFKVTCVLNLLTTLTYGGKVRTFQVLSRDCLALGA